MSESGSKFHFILPVWGSSYVEVYLNVVLATQLSDGNLGAVPLEGARYKIYTTAADELTIRQSPAFQALARRITVDFVAIDDLLRDAEWARTNDSQVQYFAPMNTIHRMAITDAARDPAVCLVFLMPDLILADGTLRFVAEAARQGKRAVMVYTLRADLDACRAALVRETSIESGSKRTVPPRLLVDLMLR
ncbi:MAG: hypothetical protein LAP21_20545, partial [Acidobacteriia bacterium]|nr:hypothetical protein [Terriglobia bacterium]